MAQNLRRRDLLLSVKRRSRRFDGTSAKYALQYRGYCAMAMTMGKLEDVDPNYFLVYEDKLLF